MAKTHVRDMTDGSTAKHILLFALPLLAGNLFQQFYNLVDSIVVGKYVGKDAFSAVGSCGSVSFLAFSLNLGLSMGIGIIVSQYFGAKQYDKIGSAIANAIYVLMSVAIVITIAGFLLTPLVLELLDTPPELMSDAVTYLRTSCLGMTAIAAYNGVSSVLRALGDSRTPLYFLIVSSFINVGLDLLFVIVFDMGVFGVALATIIAQVVSGGACIIYAYKKVDYFHLRREQLKLDMQIVKKAFALGIPVALQNSLIAISCMALQRVVNGFGISVGTSVTAAYTMTNRVEQVIQQPYSSLAMAFTTYSGQNMGAGRIDRIKKGMRQGLIMVTVFSLIMLPVMYLFGSEITSIFIDGEKEPDVIAMGATALRITSVCYLGLGLIYVPRAILNGVGDTSFAMVMGGSEVVCRILYSQIFTRIEAIGYWGIWITTGATWVTVAIVCMARYLSGRWKNKAV